MSTRPIKLGSDEERTRIDKVAAQATSQAFEQARREGREVLVARGGRLVRYLGDGTEKDEGPVPDLRAFLAQWEAGRR
jgi:hypothetical protein